MRLVGFSVARDCIALERGADYFDLHNNFDFHGLTYNPILRTLELHWVRGTGHWVKPTEPADLRLFFSGVHLFKANERDPMVPFSEDDCLDSIGFIWDELVEEMQGYTSNQPGERCSHLNANFMSGFSIKVGAECAQLYVDQAAPNNALGDHATSSLASALGP